MDLTAFFYLDLLFDKKKNAMKRKTKEMEKLHKADTETIKLEDSKNEPAKQPTC